LHETENTKLAELYDGILRHNVIYDETVVLQARRFTTPAKHDIART